MGATLQYIESIQSARPLGEFVHHRLSNNGGPLVVDCAVLDIEDVVHELDGKRLLRDGDVEVLVANLDTLNGGDNGSGTAAEGLLDAALLAGLNNIVDGEALLSDLDVAELAGEGENRVASNAGENGAVKRSGDDLALALLVLPNNQEVHGANLIDHIIGAKPEDLLEALLGGLALDGNGASIVAAKLEGTRSSGPGAVVLGVDQELDGLEASGIVGADGGVDDEELNGIRRSNAEGLVVADGGGAEVKRVTLLGGDPALVHLDELLNTVEKVGIVEGGEAEAIHGGLETAHVHLGAEETNLALLANVSLHALEALETVVKAAALRGEGKVSEIGDEGGTPSSLLGPVNLEHVRGEDGAKTHTLEAGKSLGDGSTLVNNILTERHDV